MEQKTRLWTITELIQEQNLTMPVGLLNHHILVPGNLAVLSGEAGIGKTFLTSFLADCVATGQPFAGLPTRQAKVLYISEELSDAEFRFRAINMSLHSTNGDFLSVFQTGMKIDQLEGLRALYRLCRGSQAKLVIIDSFRRIHSGPEGSNEYLSRLLLAVQKNVCRDLGIVVLFIHHAGKRDLENPNDVRGGQVIQDIARDVMVVRRTKDGLRSLGFSKVTFGIEPPISYFNLHENIEGKTVVEFQ